MKLRWIVLLGLLIAAAVGQPLRAQEAPYWVTSYENMVRALQYHEQRARGLIELEVVGQSNEGRDLYLVKVGNPTNAPVMMIAQQHGNEVINTESMLRLIHWLYRSPDAALIRENLYVLLVPRVNPDGTARYQRYNHDPLVPARDTGVGLYTNPGGGVGWDINRYHDANWEESLLYENFPGLYPVNPVPEAAAVIDTVQRFNPLWTVDFHGQFQYRTEDGRDITGSVLWPTNENADSDAVDLSKQLIVVAKDAVDPLFYSTLTEYPGGTYPGIARNAYGIYGIGSVLVEIKGGSGYLLQPGMLIDYSLRIMQAMLTTTADGTLFDADPTRVEELPPAEDNRFPYFSE